LTMIAVESKHLAVENQIPKTLRASRCLFTTTTMKTLHERLEL